MTVLPNDILRLRRMVNEPTDVNGYTDLTLTSYISAWPAVDSEGRSSDESNWTEGYDLHAAAADIWEEKAASVSAKHDFSADGSSFSANQMYTNFMEMSEHHRARQKPSSKKVVLRPIEANTNSLLYGGIYANIDPLEEDDGADVLWIDL